MYLNPAMPRSLPNGEKPGSYMLATRVGETNINPGERLVFEQYITGYGRIESAKIQCYISSDIFDFESSIVTHSLKMNSDTGMITWGRLKHKVDNLGFNAVLRGVKLNKWDEGTMFCDADSEGSCVLTELKCDLAPFSYDLVTNNNIKPGSHYIDFYLRYYNGVEWVVRNERLNFKVNSFFERHNTLISLLAATALVVTIAGSGLLPMFKAVHEIGIFVSEVHSGGRPLMPVVPQVK